MLMNPNNEHPVNSAHIPKVPPKLAILSVRVVLAFKTVVSISGLLYFSLMTIMLLTKVSILSNFVVVVVHPQMAL